MWKFIKDIWIAMTYDVYANDIKRPPPSSIPTIPEIPTPSPYTSFEKAIDKMIEKTEKSELIWDYVDNAVYVSKINNKDIRVGKVPLINTESHLYMLRLGTYWFPKCRNIDKLYHAVKNNYTKFIDNSNEEIIKFVEELASEV